MIPIRAQGVIELIFGLASITHAIKTDFTVAIAFVISSQVTHDLYAFLQ